MSGTSLPNPLSTPGVYIQEIPVLPASIVSVPTAVPVFVGYTQMAMENKAGDLLQTPFQIDSIMEYQQYFGGAYSETGLVVNIDTSQTPPVATPSVNPATASKYNMYYAVETYFDNGGGTCYVDSLAVYNSANPVISVSDYLVSGIFRPELQKYNDITLVVCPDAINMPTGNNYYELQSAVIAHCVMMQNRMAVMDVYRNPGYTWQQDVAALRNADMSTTPVTGLTVQMPENFKFAAVYFP